MAQSKQEQSPVQPEQLAGQNQPRITVAQSVLVGSVSGATEVLVNHPLWSIKTRLQRGDVFSFNPSLLYRGIIPNAASMVPITALQVGLNRFFQQVFSKDTTNLSDSRRVMVAFLAGVGSSTLSCPTEMVMTHQGQTGGSFYVAAKHLINQGGWRCLFTGLTATAMREGMFTTFFLAGTPIIKAQAQSHCKNDYVASLTAGIISGIGATLASQGVDTLKTIQQAAPALQPVHLKEAAKKLYLTEGVYGFFKGLVPRGARVVSAVTIMGLVSEKMSVMLDQNNAEDNSAVEETKKTQPKF